MNEILTYLHSVGFEDASITFPDTIKKVMHERQEDLEQGRPVFPESAIPGLALSRWFNEQIAE